MAKIALEELSSPGCVHCMEFEKFWHSIEKDWPDVEYKKTMITTPEGQDLVQKHMIFASPGIIIDSEVFSTGGFNEEKFVARLKELSGK